MSLLERDKKHLWHPLTQHQINPDNLPIVKAKGALLYDEQGNSYIDGIASWYTSMFGHCNDYILSAVQQQMQQLDQIVFAGFTHEPAIKLSEELMEILPNNQRKIFFSDNGSTANEVAIKMAIQYFANKGEIRKTIIAFDNAFHGDTFAAMSASGLSVYNHPFTDLFIEVKRIPTPNRDNIGEVLKTLDGYFKSSLIAAFIYEPLVQGANGMHVYEAKFLDPILANCMNNNVITIADEVMTGFGKTGKYFASQYMQNQPDIICLSKALTAGFVPMAITTCTQNIYEAFLSDSVKTAFFHAHTYTANPIACTAALAAIRLLKSDKIQTKIKNIIASHEQFDKQLKNHPMASKLIASTRQLGVIYAIDLTIDMQRYGAKRNNIFDFFMQHGVCLRPLGQTIYILPPYVITQEQLNKTYATIIKLINKLGN